MSVSGGVGASFDNASPSVGASRGGSWIRAAVVILGFVGSLYVIEGVDMVLSYDSPPGAPGELDSAGIEPREVAGLDGILWAPMLHGGWDHLFANTMPLLVLGFLVLLSGIGRGIAGDGDHLGDRGRRHLAHRVDGECARRSVGDRVRLADVPDLSRHGSRAISGQIALGLVILVIYGVDAVGRAARATPGFLGRGILFGAMGGVRRGLGALVG